MVLRLGAVAQLVARLTGSQKVRGSNPLSSTIFQKHTFLVKGSLQGKDNHRLESDTGYLG
jgi:hypothetical protein